MAAAAPALTFRAAFTDDAPHVMAVRIAAARALTLRFGQGPWSTESTERGVLAGMRQSLILLAFEHDIAVGTFRLTSRKPWAMDRGFFTPAKRPLYLTDMAVLPALQGRGVGRACLAYADAIARNFPGDAIWLDAYDAPAGAGAFYAACGYRECARATYRGTPLVYYEHLLK